MVAQSIIIALVAVTQAAPPDAGAAAWRPSATRVAEIEPRTRGELRDAVRETLRRLATATGAAKEAAARDLAALYQELNGSTGLRTHERRRLSATVRTRLFQARRSLERALAAGEVREAPPAARANRLAARRNPVPEILAQVPANLAGPQGNAPARQANPARQFGPGRQVIGAAQSWSGLTNRNAENLIDLIQTTIAPSSWQRNGGLGTIKYFAPRQVLVIRQRGDVHDQVGGALNALRGQ